MTAAVSSPPARPDVAALPVRADVTVSRRARPRPAVDIDRMTRYRGGTYSHTVDTVVFVDGTVARTDLIWLNPNVEAYSLDFSGIAPTKPSRYLVQSWTAVPNVRAHAFEAEVDWILRNSFPNLKTGELSRRLRAEGHLLGSGNISEHEAIAATQAAIWSFTNGLALDNRPLNTPTRVQRTGTAGKVLVVEFEDAPELRSYVVDLVGDGPAAVTLEKSEDGVSWSEVAASRVSAAAGGQFRKSLGVGTTVSAIRHGRSGRGYRFYRLTAVGAATIADASFSLASGTYRNSERVVALYNYLLAGARRARSTSTAPRLTAVGATHSEGPDGLVGPFRLDATDAAALSATDAQLVDADGRELTGPVAPGGVFYLRPTSDARTATVTMTVPGGRDGYGGRVLTGVALDEAVHRYTPLALAVPAQLVVDLDIAWSSTLAGATR